MDARPNILFLMNDQQKASAASVNGNRTVPSPFMDEVAAGGVTFLDAYSPSPICTPSRASLMTGVHPLVHQVTCHQNRAPANLRQLPEFLAAAGYHTAVAGHYEANRNLGRGWHEQATLDEDPAMKGALAYWYSHGRGDVGWSSGTQEITPEEGHAHHLTDRVLHMLDGIEAANAPFFLHVPYLEPHPPYFAPAAYASLVDPDTIELPAEGDAQGRPAWQEEVRRQLGRELATEDDIRRLIAVYYGMIAYADDQMRRLVAAMSERGLMENTWIIICSDHGDYTGEKGLFMKSEALYECLLHVPLVITPPAIVDWPRGQALSGLVDLVDLFPTILGLAGAETPAYAQGQDLIAWVNGGTQAPLRDTLYAQVGDYHGNLKTTAPSGLPESGRRHGLMQCARSRDAVYIRDPDWGDEAYDLRRDPAELNNLLLAAEGGVPAEVDAMKQRLNEWEAACLRLRAELNIVPGYSGFD